MLQLDSHVIDNTHNKGSEIPIATVIQSLLRLHDLCYKNRIQNQEWNGMEWNGMEWLNFNGHAAGMLLYFSTRLLNYSNRTVSIAPVMYSN